MKEPDFRVVLTALRPGAWVEQHAAAGRLTIQALHGCLRLHLGGKTVDLASGQVLALERQVPHDVEALDESAFLLTLAWPAGDPSASS